MNINSVSANVKPSSMTFECNKNRECCCADEFPKYKKEKNALPAVASYFIPGMGQFMNGNNKSGFKFMGIEALCGIVIGTVVGAAQAAILVENPSKLIKKISSPVVTGIALGAAGVGVVINRIVSSVQAYKGK